MEPAVTPRLFVQAWSDPHPTHTPDENEDAIEVRNAAADDSGGETLLIAVADGGTTAIYAGLWARTLVAAARPEWPGLSDADLTQALDEVRAGFDPVGEESVPWYVTEKLALEGSFSTLLVCRIQPSPSVDKAKAQVVAVGDSCLFVFRREGHDIAFPSTASSQLGAYPDLITTQPQPDLSYRRWEGELRLGDVVMVCTDALARWVLECVEAGDRAAVLESLGCMLGGTSSDGALTERLSAASMRRIVPDDMTMALCALTPTATSEPRGAVAEMLRGLQQSLTAPPSPPPLLPLPPSEPASKVRSIKAMVGRIRRRAR